MNPTQSPSLTESQLNEIIEQLKQSNNRPDNSFGIRLMAITAMTLGTIVFCNTWDLMHGKDTVIDKMAGTDFSSPIKEGQKFGSESIIATSNFGEVRGDKIHEGVDIAMPEGTALYFPYLAGSIKCGEDPSGWGIYATVTSENPSDPVLLLGHLSRCQDFVYRLNETFEPLNMRSGNTGRSTGAHLHLEQRVNGGLVPPQKGYLWAILTGKRVGANNENVKAELQAIAENIAADNPEVTPELILAIADRESNLGEALDANGLGDNGNGCGIWQVDKRYHPDFVKSVNCATDHAEIARYAIEQVLIPYSKELGSMEQAIAAYNAGPESVKEAVAQRKDPDSVTTGKNYSVDVLARIEKFK